MLTWPPGPEETEPQASPETYNPLKFLETKMSFPGWTLSRARSTACSVTWMVYDTVSVLWAHCTLPYAILPGSQALLSLSLPFCVSTTLGICSRARNLNKHLIKDSTFLTTHAQ